MCDRDSDLDIGICGAELVVSAIRRAAIAGNGMETREMRGEKRREVELIQWHPNPNGQAGLCLQGLDLVIGEYWISHGRRGL